MEIHPHTMDSARHSTAMIMMFRTRAMLATLCILIALGASPTNGAEHVQTSSDGRAAIGKVLFFDMNFSRDRSQSCASCHEPRAAFVDPRENASARAASLGAGGHAFGDRNTPSIAYAAQNPAFHFDPDGEPRGGFFLDGRAANLASQATEPILNPIEMGLANGEQVRERVIENEYYVTALKREFGPDIIEQPDKLLAALGECLSAFEQTAFFSEFDSKYDRYLRKEYSFNALEEMGRSLFFSPLTNCTQCHLNDPSGRDRRETFTNFRYHNIGVPVNVRLRQLNNLGLEHSDPGLGANPAVTGTADALGRYKVPSLRNVAVTGPYMHNGVFTTLHSAIAFYNQYIVRNRTSQTNPDTGLAWGETEYPETIDTDLLKQGQPIDEGRIKALIAFLETLTDRRYEHLLEKTARTPAKLDEPG